MKGWGGTIAVVVVCALLIVWIANGGDKFWE